MARYNTYSTQQIAFLKTNTSGKTRAELTELFNETFNTAKSIRSIKSFCNNRKFYCGSSGQFKNKHVSWQTGLSGNEYRKHYTKESFEKSKVGIRNRRRHKVGDTTMRHGQPYVIVSIENNTIFDNRIVPKRRFVYEQHFGKIAKNHRVVVLDGNKENVIIDNLCCIPDKFVPTLNKNHWLTNSQVCTLVAVKWCELFYTIKERK